MAQSFNINQVAEIMGMTLKVIRRFVASGELKTTKKNNQKGNDYPSSQKRHSLIRLLNYSHHLLMHNTHIEWNHYINISK